MSYCPVGEDAAAVTRVVIEALDRLEAPDRLLALRSLSVLIGSRKAKTVVDARQLGYSWAEIADRLGMSRQSVWQRYGGARGVATASEGSAGEPVTFSSCAAYKAVSSRPGPGLGAGS